MEIENVSIGIDTEDVERFRGKPVLFYDRIFTQKERVYCDAKEFPEQHYAARFCAKEAFIKAIYGFGFGPVLIPLNTIEIYHDEYGYPKIYCEAMRFISTKVSLSHSETQAVACVIALKSNENV